MKQILVLSGKGGTGKTTFAITFACLSKDISIAADCDVDAADMYLVFEPINSIVRDFYSGYLPEIDPRKCFGCSICSELCAFDAIQIINNKAVLIEDECEGCAYCSRVCPRDAIIMQERLIGNIQISQSKYGVDLVHAKLAVGGENSGKLVSEVKKTAKIHAEKLGKELLIIDGSPGIGCPVNASLSGVDYVVIVAEGSKSGFNDMKRLSQLISNFRIKSGCIVNKADINPEITSEIRHYAIDNSIDFISQFDFNPIFNKANSQGVPVLEIADDNLKEKFNNTWQIILNNLEKK